MDGYRSKFEAGLDDLEELLLEMYDLTKKTYENVLKSLENTDKDLAMKIIRNDEQINNLEEQINEDGVLLIAKQAPVAIDLRRIMTGIKIASDIERIADYAVNIAKYIMKKESHDEFYVDKIKQLILILLDMFEDVIKAAIDNDVELSKIAAEKDTSLDEAYGKMVKELTEIGKNEVSSKSEDAINTLLIIKQIERAGDHVTNIAENIIYLVKGKRYDLN